MLSAVQMPEVRMKNTMSHQPVVRSFSSGGVSDSLRRITAWIGEVAMP